MLLHQRRSMKGRKKIASKIITNPMYDAEGREVVDVPEYRPTEDELKVRRALLAFEKKKNKEKKKTDKDKKEETKKGDAESKEEGKEEEEKEEKEEKEEEKDEEDADEDKDDKREMKQAEEEVDDNQDTQSSVTSGSTGSTMRSFYSLRAAIDEKYVPLSIRNMSCSANIVFMLLLGLASMCSHFSQNSRVFRDADNAL